MTTVLKLAAGLVAGLAVLGAVHMVAGWREDANTLKACVAAASPKAPANADPAKACPGAIGADHLVAVRARACDQALSARPENAYGVKASCSEPVKTVQAERDVARSEAANLTTELNQERLGQDAAIARASASASALAERKARAAAALLAAPRDGDGLVVCDAQCVRDRWGGAAARP